MLAFAADKNYRDQEVENEVSEVVLDPDVEKSRGGIDARSSIRCTDIAPHRLR